MFCELFTRLYQMGVNPPSDIASGRIAEAFLNLREAWQ